MRILPVIALIVALGVNHSLAGTSEQSQIISDDQEVAITDRAIPDAAPQGSTKRLGWLEALLQALMEMFNQNSSESDSETEQSGGNPYGSGGALHDEAVSAIANNISNDTGVPAQNYVDYADSLADTLGQLDPAALARVLGENMGTLP